MLLSIVQFEKLMIIKLKSDLYLCCGLSLAEGNPWCLIRWFSSGYDSTSAINLNLFRRVERTIQRSTIFEMPYFYLYTSVSLSKYPSLKPLDTNGGFCGTYFSKAVICFVYFRLSPRVSHRKISCEAARSLRDMV